MPGKRSGGEGKSGCPDLNWGPLRPERSALPGCATPRSTHRLAALVEESLDRVRACIRPFADQQMAAIGDHAERRAAAAGILGRVADGELSVAGAPEEE